MEDSSFISRGRFREPRTAGLLREVTDTHYEMNGALAFALESRNRRSRFVEHCARVTRLVERIATELELEGEDFFTLRFAAQLHEIGMVAVPPELIEKPEPLTEGEVERVRAQAWIGAAIVGATHSPRTARLIQHQYADHAELRDSLPATGNDLLLVGILRVADVFDTMCNPRPYQWDLAPSRIRELFADEVGIRFHPAAVDTLFKVRPQLTS